MARWLTWLRLYTNWHENPKVAMLPPALQLTWLKLITEAGKRGGFLPDDLAEVAFTLRCSVEAIHSALAQLETARLFEKRDGQWVPHDFADWQYPSDSSTERSRKHREVKRCGNVAATVNPNVAATVNPNVAATDRPEQSRPEQSREKVFDPPLAQPRTEPTTSEARPVIDAFHSFIALWPNPEKVDNACRQWISYVGTGDITDAELPRIMAGLEAYKASARWHDEGGKYIPLPENWLKNKQWKDSPRVAEAVKAEVASTREWTGNNPNEEYKGRAFHAGLALVDGGRKVA